jgi:altronate dehydratase small subunit
MPVLSEQKAVIIDAKDNVATALVDLKAGDTVELKPIDKGLRLVLKTAIPFGHKFCLTNVKAGSAVIKYGETIGIAVIDIQPSEHVHTHNAEVNFRLISSQRIAQI